MSKTKKHFGITQFFFSFVAVCIVIYIFQDYKGSVATMITENDILEDIINANGIIVKDETVYQSSVDGTVTYYKEDGEKLKEGILVADINTDVSAQEINKQLAEIETAIEYKKNNQDDNEKESVVYENLNQETITVFQSELQESILNKDLDSMYNIIGQVDNNVTPSESKYADYSLEQLEKLASSLTVGLSNNKIPYYSGKPGLITYKIDGLENVYNFENVMNMSPSSTVKKEYSLTDMKSKESISTGDSIYKIISNFEYYIVATVSNQYAKLFEENKFIKTRIIVDGIESEVWGYIKKINYGSEESALILYFDDYFYKIYDKRYVDLELITNIHEGLKVDKKALITKDGQIGVYIKDASGIVKFLPVEVLGEDENIVIASQGQYVGENQRNIIKISDKSYNTIKIFDNIILEPDKVYEGKILDY